MTTGFLKDGLQIMVLVFGYEETFCMYIISVSAVCMYVLLSEQQ